MAIFVQIAAAVAASGPASASLSVVPSSTENAVPVSLENASPQEECVRNACVISYEAAFFGRYNPVTALDMVRNLPGFQIDDGDGSRGFGGSAGNILINGERVAAKSETASDVLSRTPVASVERIDLIRGQTGGLDLRGQSVVANVILKDDAGAAAAWEVENTVNLPAPGVFPSGELSFRDKVGALSYTIGGEIERYQFRSEGPERLTGGDGALRELRQEVFAETGFEGEASVNAQLNVGQTAIRFNGSASYFEEDGGETSERFRTGGVPPFFVLQGDADDGLSFEVGGDIERSFGDRFAAKLIGIYRKDDERERGSLARGPSVDSAPIDTVSVSETIDTESILRLEMDYQGIPGHLIEIAAEGAVNSLDSMFALFEDEGGGLVPQSVPGANTKVEEIRGDFSVSDSFSIGAIGVDAALAAETSTIEQTGEFEAERSFFFWKPSLTATLSPDDRTQIRLRGLREVGQLDFFDFVSSADLGDEELALGNPELTPETNWTVDVALERRFGEIGVFSVTVFYDWIDDVQDFLPAGEGLEVPGNIGAGVRRGLRAEGAAPLDAFGVSNSRLDFSGEYQFSRVTDPVTGETRRLSNEQGWEAQVEFRQDLTEQRWAWGWDIFFADRRPFFGLDERNTSKSRPDFDAFLETTRFGGLRVRLGAENLLNEGVDRDRLVFAEARGPTAPLRFRELRRRNNGREMFLSVSGTF